MLADLLTLIGLPAVDPVVVPRRYTYSVEKRDLTTVSNTLNFNQKVFLTVIFNTFLISNFKSTA